MADEQVAPERTEEEVVKESLDNSDALRLDDDRYVGVDPIYKNAAYMEPLEAEPEGRTKAAKEAVQGELDMVQRVKENEAGCVVNVDVAPTFEEWVPTSTAAMHQQGVRGLNEEQVEKDRQATEDAKNEEGRIPPSSGSTQQPGVLNA